MEKIYRTFNDIEVYQTATKINCPHCKLEWYEPDADECGKTYTLTCLNEECEKEFEMYFDAN